VVIGDARPTTFSPVIPLVISCCISARSRARACERRALSALYRCYSVAGILERERDKKQSARGIHHGYLYGRACNADEEFLTFYGRADTPGNFSARLLRKERERERERERGKRKGGARARRQEENQQPFFPIIFALRYFFEPAIIARYIRRRYILRGAQNAK